MEAKDLVNGETYLLRYSDQFCNGVMTSGVSVEIDEDEEFEAVFIGLLLLDEGERAIFYNGGYLMFGTEEMDYVVE